MAVLATNYETMFNGCVKGGIDFLEKNPKIEAFVIGLSGGVDSTVVAALARRIADLSGIKLVGRSMPIVSNAADEIERARLCAAFCHEFEEQDMSEAWRGLLGAIAPDIAELEEDTPLAFEQKIRAGNIKARLRMIKLYDLAAKNHGLVLSTDNYTELLMGFWTLHGDVGDLGLIQKLFKTEVYGMAAWMAKHVFTEGDEHKALVSSVEAKPTDGLGVSNSDLDQLLPGVEYTSWQEGYAMVDKIITGWMLGNSAVEPSHPVIARYKATHFKRENPVSLKRDFLLWTHNSV